MRLRAAAELLLLLLLPPPADSAAAPAPTPGSSGPLTPLRIKASSTSRGGAKSFFQAEEEAPAPAPLAAPGFLWATAAGATGAPPISVHAFRDADDADGEDADEDEDDDGDDDDDDDDDDDETSQRAPRVHPYKRHWTIKLGKHARNAGYGADATGGVDLTVDASPRTFVRAITSSDTALVARVVVRGDAKALVDAAVHVTDAGNASSLPTSTAFRVSSPPATTAPLSGRVLVQVLINTRFFHLASLRAAGDSVVVVADDELHQNANAAPPPPLMRSTDETPLFLSTERAMLFLSLGNALRATALAVRAEDTSSLLLQSAAGLSLASLDLRQQQHATLALVAQRISSASISVFARSDGDGGRLCLHGVARSSASVFTADVSGDDALLEWTQPPSTASGGDATCDLLQVRVAGGSARADLGALSSQVANVSVDGADAVAVVRADQQLIYASSPDARGVAFVGRRPWLAFGARGRLVAATPADTSAALTSRCALKTLASDFQRPIERAAFVSLAPPAGAAGNADVGADKQSHSPDPYGAMPNPRPEPVRSPLEQLASGATELPAAPVVVATQPPAVTSTATAAPVATRDASSSTDGAGGEAHTFVNGSLHMLGSIPYMDAIVVFLASAWVLHHLLQCYDRRQRRRAYAPLGERPPRSAADEAADDRVWI